MLTIEVTGGHRHYVCVRVREPEPEQSSEIGTLKKDAVFPDKPYRVPFALAQLRNMLAARDGVQMPGMKCSNRYIQGAGDAVGDWDVALLYPYIAAVQVQRYIFDCDMYQDGTQGELDGDLYIDDWGVDEHKDAWSGMETCGWAGFGYGVLGYRYLSLTLGV
jgi:hypothetical protein